MTREFVSKIEDDIRPSAPVVNVLAKLRRIISTCEIIPSHDSIDLTKILKLDKRPTKLKESDTKRISRGMKLSTCRWLPANGEQKALVFLCHGYSMESSISMKGRKGSGTRLAKAGYGVYGMDYEGHGRSYGLPGYIPSFEDVVTDCSDHYTRISERKENVKKSRFLMGESMGGTVAILLHLKKPNFWDSAVLVAPMCKVCCLPG